jgi:transcriptional regulatory protein RtcR
LARWPGNFRDLAASITRMATFSPKGRIDVETVTKEITRLTRLWSGADRHGDGLDMLLGAETLASIDPFDRVQLAHVVETCQASRSLSEAGRQLFAASREKRASTNDADRLRKYLARFSLDWDMVCKVRN